MEISFMTVLLSGCACWLRGGWPMTGHGLALGQSFVWALPRLRRPHAVTTRDCWDLGATRGARGRNSRPGGGGESRGAEGQLAGASCAGRWEGANGRPCGSKTLDGAGYSSPLRIGAAPRHTKTDGCIQCPVHGFLPVDLPRALVVLTLTLPGLDAHAHGTRRRFVCHGFVCALPFADCAPWGRGLLSPTSQTADTSC